MIVLSSDSVPKSSSASNSCCQARATRSSTPALAQRLSRT